MPCSILHRLQNWWAWTIFNNSKPPKNGKYQKQTHHKMHQFRFATLSIISLSMSFLFFFIHIVNFVVNISRSYHKDILSVCPLLCPFVIAVPPDQFPLKGKSIQYLESSSFCSRVSELMKKNMYLAIYSGGACRCRSQINPCLLICRSV